MDGKDLLQSKQFWGSVLLFLGPVLKAIGHPIAPDQIEPITTALSSMIGGLLVLWGQLSATRAPITSVAGVQVR